jgi:hypothetical protein
VTVQSVDLAPTVVIVAPALNVVIVAPALSLAIVPKAVQPRRLHPLRSEINFFLFFVIRDFFS